VEWDRREQKQIGASARGAAEDAIELRR
jgi:hypothetical protein